MDKRIKRVNTRLSAVGESRPSVRPRRMHEAFDSKLESLIEEMKSAIKAHDARKAQLLYQKADKLGYYLSTNWAMSGFEAGVYGNDGFAHDLVLYIPTKDGWDYYEGDRRNWPEPYCGFSQIRNDSHVKVVESKKAPRRLHEAEDEKVYVLTVDVTTSKFYTVAARNEEEAEEKLRAHLDDSTFFYEVSRGQYHGASVHVDDIEEADTDEAAMFEEDRERFGDVQ